MALRRVLFAVCVCVYVNPHGVSVCVLLSMNFFFVCEEVAAGTTTYSVSERLLSVSQPPGNGGIYVTNALTSYADFTYISIPS